MSAAAEKETSSTLIYRSLRADILRGIIAPGEKLVIDALARQYRTSNIPIREALTRLGSERLVERFDQRGFSVAAISLESWRQIVNTRCWLETKALELSMTSRTQEWEERIVVAFHRLSRKIWVGLDTNVELRMEWEVLHREFHQALIANNGSPWLTEFCDTLMAHAERYLAISASSEKPFANNIEDHRVLMDSALDGDIKTATTALVEHYERTFQKVAAEMDSEKIAAAL
ncbi:GntR family transcriptional regulator [Aureimonas fodinaquatilis]|uniref:GntR family transcriptional regulator n=1 Tax=Aureimonas fodinaquatilis TaxID=2565783 RepID=A0A5B0DTR7_9HYPH|nr:GntR family transcriptional regulator [Aureimonas fodinaquatilis]KAA0969325.1 GntR family transcriptional regulator [Aureimonas fodinaquatilis]